MIHRSEILPPGCSKLRLHSSYGNLLTPDNPSPGTLNSIWMDTAPRMEKRKVTSISIGNKHKGLHHLLS